VARAVLHSDLRAERTDEVVSLRRGEAAELYVGAPGADGGRLRGVIADEEGLVAVEIWLAAVPVFGVPAADPAHAFDMLDEDERTCPHDVRLVPTDIALEDVGLVDPVPWRRQRGNEWGRWPLELERDDVRLRRLDGLDLQVLTLARRRDPWRRIDDLLVGGAHVSRSQLAAIVELHPATKLENVGALVRRNGPRRGQIPDDPGARRIERVAAQQRVVVRSRRVYQPKRLLLVSVVGRRLARYYEGQRATRARLGQRDGRRLRGRARRC